MFLSFFVMFFLCTGKVEASCYPSGVIISKDCGIYDVESSNFNIGESEEDNGHKVYTVKSRPWYDGANPRITVDLSKFGLNSQALFHGAYKTIVIIFQITLKEVNDGYQEFYLVDDVDYKNNLAEPNTTFEHGVGYENGKYRRYEFYAEVPGKRFTTSSFTLGFSAHGFAWNDWKFRNVRVQVCLSNEQRKIESIMWKDDAIVDPINQNEFM